MIFVTIIFVFVVNYLVTVTLLFLLYGEVYRGFIYIFSVVFYLEIREEEMEKKL